MSDFIFNNIEASVLGIMLLYLLWTGWREQRATQQHSMVRQSEALYRTLARNLPNASVILFDGNLRCIIVEGPVLAAHGVPHECVEGKTITEVVPADIGEDFLPYCQAALAGKESTFERTCEKFTYFINTLPVKNEHGKICAGMLLSQDITERKRAERALRASDELLRTVIASVPIFLFALDNTGAYTLLEGKGLDLLQLKPGDGMGRSVFDVYRDLPEVQAHHQRALQGELFTAIVEVAEMVFETHYSPLRDEYGNVCSVIGVVTDITERERSREALRQQRDFALRVMDTMGQGLIVTNLNREFEFVNPAGARMLGYPAEVLIGMPVRAVVFPDDRHILDAAFTRRFAGETTTYELRLHRADGQLVHVLINGVPRWHDGRVVGSIAVITDLTGHRQMQADLELARNQALEASRLKSEFLATMSHEIRTPMNAIIGMTELLIDTPLDHTQREFATIVHESGRVLLTIIDDILDFSKIEAGKLVLDRIEFSPVAAVEGTAELMATKAYEKQLALMTFVDPAIPQQLIGDPGRLRQVLLNLMSNAIKFTNRGEVVVRATLESETETHVILRFAIRDTGIGLSDMVRKRLFEPFTQEDGSTTRRYGGTGLGLAISKHLAEMMGGAIGFESEVYQGSTFWFTARFERVLVPTPAALPEATLLEGTRILIIAANQTHREILQSYAASWGVASDGAASGAVAQHLLHTAIADEWPYALAIIGHVLPDQDGFALAQTIQRDPLIGPTPLVFLSPVDECEQRQQVAQAGFVDYLTMPVQREQFGETLIGIITGQTQVATAQDACQWVPAARLSSCARPPVARTDKLILLVEDNPANQRLALRQLEKLGYTVHAVANGRDAVEAVTCAASVYALVLMDCQTPEMDGYAATRAIRDLERRSGRHLPIVAMTANAMQGDREACLAAGMDDYLSKPVSLQTLGVVLERWLPAVPDNGVSANGSYNGATNGNGCLLDAGVIACLRELQAAGEPNFLSELIDIYFNDAPTFIGSMRAALLQDDLVTVREAAHSFKGSSASIGARTVAALCRELERVIRAGNTAGAYELLLKIEAEYERVKPVLEAERSGK